MLDSEPLVIIGSGLAGLSAAAGARSAGFDGQVILVGEESNLPYDRPPLSKRVLTTPGSEEKIFLRKADWYTGSAIDLHLGQKVTSIDRIGRKLALSSGDSISYGRLIIATGASVLRLPAIEHGTVPTRYLRTRTDAIALREHLIPGARLAIVGGGVIGLEVASSAIKLGCNVTIIESADRLMARSFAPSISAFLETLHRDRGVEFMFNEIVRKQQTIEGTRGQVVLDSGGIVDADIILVCVGVTPNLDIAKEAGIACEQGVVVDEFGSTCDPNIFAVGDVAQFRSELYQSNLRLEAWQHARNQGEVVGRNAVVSQPQAYNDVPWFWTDQHDQSLQLVGLTAGDTEVVRRSEDPMSFVTFHLASGRLVGATLVNAGGQRRPIQTLIANRSVVPTEMLADNGTRLRSLAKEFVS